MKSKSSISSELGLPVVYQPAFNVPVNAQLGIFSSGPGKTTLLNASDIDPSKLNILGIPGTPKISLRSADYKETGKLGMPNDATLADAKAEAYSKYPQSIGRTPDFIQNQLDKIDLDISNFYTQLGEGKTSFGKLLGKDFKGTGTCGKDHACMNKALARIKEYENRKTELQQEMKDAEIAQQSAASSGSGAAGSSSTTTPVSGNSVIKWVVIGVAGLAVIGSVMAIIKRVKK
jgi:hypothetical protein